MGGSPEDVSPRRPSAHAAHPLRHRSHGSMSSIQLGRARCHRCGKGHYRACRDRMAKLISGPVTQRVADRTSALLGRPRAGEDQH